MKIELDAPAFSTLTRDAASFREAVSAAGSTPAAAWTTALRRAGCTVDGFHLPDGMKDLGDCLQKLPADDPFRPRLFVFP